MIQDEALQILKMGHNVFLTGPAGSGKTFLLNKYINFLKICGVKVGITASTGVAATHMNGKTVHSWSGIGIKDKLAPHDIRNIFKNSKTHKRIKETKVLVIDEVSMLHAHQLDLVNHICKAAKNSALPFGGMQVILCGDFFQLPPVKSISDDANGGSNQLAALVKFGPRTANCINKSIAWNIMNIKICYLTEQYRQADDGFLNILNNIRKNSVTKENIEALAARMGVKTDRTVTKLYTHNYDVDKINNFELYKIKEKPMTYKMRSFGRPPLVDLLKRSCLAPEKLILKKGAAVMFVKNNFEDGYVNGTLGKVIDFVDGLPVIKTNAGNKILAKPASWVLDDDGFKEAEISQLPLRLAWAITVHKSQGMTLDAAQIDLKKAFEYGMGYVALSRVKSLNGLYLRGINDMAMQINPEIMELDTKFVQVSEKVAGELNQLNSGEIKRRQDNFLKLIAPPDFEYRFYKEAPPKIKEPKIPNHKKTKELILQKMPLQKIANHCGFAEGTIIRHIEKLLEMGEAIDVEYLKPEQEKFEKIKAALLTCGNERLKPIYDFLEEKFSYNEIRLAQLFIKIYE